MTEVKTTNKATEEMVKTDTVMSQPLLKQSSKELEVESDDKSDKLSTVSSSCSNEEECLELKKNEVEPTK